MPWVAMPAIAFLWLSTAPPTPPPTPAEGAGVPDTPVSVRVVRSRAAQLRAATAEAVQCQPLPVELARPAEAPLPAHVPAETSIAGSAKTLGILLPRADKGYPLSLFARGRATGTYVLKPPPQGPTYRVTPTLSLGEEGSLAALSGRDGFVVYANGVLTGVFDQEAASAAVAFRFGEVMWCPWPQRAAARHRVSAGKLFEEGEEPPLWLRAELDGSDRKVLARIDPGRLDPDFPNPAEWAMGIATRRDGKLWLVGLSSGEVWLASPGGRILRRDSLPVRLRSEEDDEAALHELKKETLRQVRSQPSPELADPTRRQPRGVQVVATAATRVIGRVMARDDDLVVTTIAAEPARAVIYVPAGGGPAHCWTVPGRGEMLRAAVTGEALWWLAEGEEVDARLLYLPWGDLLPPEDGSAEGNEAPQPPPTP